MKHSARALLLGLLLAAPAGLPALAAGFDDFALVEERNIFNPDRRADTTRPTTETEEVEAAPAPAPVSEQMNLLGTWLTRERRVAFILTQPGSTLTSVTLGMSCGDWEISAIDSHAVQLQGATGKLRWPVGQRMERTGDEPWALAGANVAARPSPPTGGPPQEGPPKDGPPTAVTPGKAGADSGPTNDVAKRMMERRRRERKK